MKRYILAGLAAALTAAAPAYARHDGRDAAVNERQHRLEQRIERGWRSGDLTRREYRRLNYELREIDSAERYFMSDGHLTRRERGELYARLDALSRDIFRERRDGEVRPGSYNHGYPGRGGF